MTRGISFPNRYQPVRLDEGPDGSIQRRAVNVAQSFLYRSVRPERKAIRSYKTGLPCMGRSELKGVKWVQTT